MKYLDSTLRTYRWWYDSLTQSSFFWTLFYVKNKRKKRKFQKSAVHPSSGKEST